VILPASDMLLPPSPPRRPLGRGLGRARSEEAVDGFLEKAPLHDEGARREHVVAPTGEAANGSGVREEREHEAEEPERQVGDLLRLPAGVERRLPRHLDALLVERTEPARHERLPGAVLLDERALEETAEMRVRDEVRGQLVDRAAHLLGLELPRPPRVGDDRDDRAEPALEDGVVEGLLAREVVVEARR